MQLNSPLGFPVSGPVSGGGLSIKVHCFLSPHAIKVLSKAFLSPSPSSLHSPPSLTPIPLGTIPSTLRLVYWQKALAMRLEFENILYFQTCDSPTSLGPPLSPPSATTATKLSRAWGVTWWPALELAGFQPPFVCFGVGITFVASSPCSLRFLGVVVVLPRLV